ncbi:MAG TPA: indole-3-glycerol phosphate synthase TrpC [Chthonomonadaceae bacterium]|nr:indole-3-glycerol phosphate synthase TrpC [Chthonomonadaceae bacterium]
MSMLSEILATKRTEVTRQREKVSLEFLQERLIDAPPTRDFRAALVSAPGTALIAEVKKASPSKGVIRADFDPLEIARTYAENGAACLSVLTDETYFQGKLQYLREIRRIVSVPLLRKDFIVDPWQILESRAAGADAILLIVAALTPGDLRYFLKIARQYDLAALVEVHDREEMEEALNAGADLIGINNRDLHTFRTTLDTTLDLVSALPPEPNRLIVSESGIFTRADVERLQAAGVDAVLVGEALISAPDIGAKVRELLGQAESGAQEADVPLTSQAR